MSDTDAPRSITITLPIPGRMNQVQGAAVHGVSTETIKRLTRDGTLTPIRVGHSLLYAVEELNRVFGEPRHDVAS